MRSLLIGCAVIAAGVLAPAASADGQTYLAELRDVGLSNPPITGDSGLVIIGQRLCEALRAGQSPQDVANMLTLNWTVSAHKEQVTAAAQRELCPDTLR